MNQKPAFSLDRALADPEHFIWLAYRLAIAKHIEAEAGQARYETEAEYRERAEKAGLAAVVNLVKKAFAQ